MVKISEFDTVSMRRQMRTCTDEFLALVTEGVVHGVYKFVTRSSFGVTFIYLFGVLRRFQHCTGHITTGSWKGRGNQYIEFARVVYCKLPTNGKQLPAFPLKAVTAIEPRPQRWEARVLPLCHRGPSFGVTQRHKTSRDKWMFCHFVTRSRTNLRQ